MITDAVRSSLPATCLACPIMRLATDQVVPRVVREAIRTRDMTEHAHLLADYQGWRVARGESTRLERQLESWHALEVMVCERPLELRPKRYARAWGAFWKTPTQRDSIPGANRSPSAPTDRTRINWLPTRIGSHPLRGACRRWPCHPTQ